MPLGGWVDKLNHLTVQIKAYWKSVFILTILCNSEKNSITVFWL